MEADFAGLSAIGQIAVNVKDVDRAAAFWRDVLGVRHLFSAPGMAFFAAGDVRVMLARPDRPEFDHPSSILYFTVPDIQAAHAALASRRVAFRTKPHVVHRDANSELWLADFVDTEGNTLALMQQRRA